MAEGVVVVVAVQQDHVGGLKLPERDVAGFANQPKLGLFALERQQRSSGGTGSMAVTAQYRSFAQPSSSLVVAPLNAPTSMTDRGSTASKQGKMISSKLESEYAKESASLPSITSLWPR